MQRCAGFTVLELLCAASMGLLIVLGGMGLMLGVKRLEVKKERVLQAQDEGIFIVQTLLHEKGAMKCYTASEALQQFQLNIVRGTQLLQLDDHLYYLPRYKVALYEKQLRARAAELVRGISAFNAHCEKENSGACVAMRVSFAWQDQYGLRKPWVFEVTRAKE